MHNLGFNKVSFNWQGIQPHRNNLSAKNEQLLCGWSQTSFQKQCTCVYNAFIGWINLFSFKKKKEKKNINCHITQLIDYKKRARHSALCTWAASILSRWYWHIFPRAETTLSYAITFSEWVALGCLITISNLERASGYCSNHLSKKWYRQRSQAYDSTRNKSNN